ncbi:redoxin family protein [Asticcacaulis biprosthecium C19]|uniref:Glutathione-dependent peroxiredoxin n=1 Tax=Asticcacaulis biprosthecium C19 TaxID=715226 RepID=F4QT01_9CAUL|nr:peroxiredoxin [Asticcacaulis biprosthecium]EGF89871.1 redoxin family protein [Asticcacaulis biprosthecium C19]
MTVQPGDTLPDLKLTVVGAESPQPTTVAEFFAGKTVVLFAVPGAFTPTCSARHLPGFKDHVADFTSKGVDVVACTSVNDYFVMKAWAKDQGIVDEVVLLADGNGDFAKAVGLELDGTGFGMGPRSKRYAMVVKDGKVDQLFVEAPGEFRVSSAEHVLEQL